MPDIWTRRRFLQRAVAAGGGLTLGRLQQCPALVAAEGAAADAGRLPLLVVTETVSSDVNPRAPAWGYIAEILRRAGAFFQQAAPAALESVAQRGQIVVVLAGNLALAASQREALATWVQEGGALVGIGGTSGLDEVFGVAGGMPLAEGWIKPGGAPHPLTAGLRSSLHVFGGYAVKKGTATVVAEFESRGRGPRGSAILENRFGRGRAVLLAPDLVFSIVHIQQGLPVLQDGKPPGDDSAPLDDGALKAEDGLVLDWHRDRSLPVPGGPPVFLEPASDELREIILRAVFYCAQQQGIALPVLWYWPRGLAAVGLVSHDSDGNDPAKAAAMLEVMNRCRTKSSWCVQFPGGYPSEFYRKLQDQEFEIALHYDAMTGGPQTSWSKENFLRQHRWLLAEAGLREIASNKNHYTRWEGRLDFFRWCESAGIVCDQTRGPSKKGTVGFPLGGSQPYFPWDDEALRPRLLKVLEVNLLTQDLRVFCPVEYGRPLLDSALRHHGVAHFLFHPAHILKADMADTLCGLVDYGRTRGLEWWTSRQIHQWEALRRGVTASFEAGPRGLTISAPTPLREATLLLLRTRPQPARLTLEGRAAATATMKFCGFEFDAITADLAGSVRLQWV